MCTLAYLMVVKIFYFDLKSWQMPALYICNICKLCYIKIRFYGNCVVYNMIRNINEITSTIWKFVILYWIKVLIIQNDNKCTTFLYSIILELLNNGHFEIARGYLDEVLCYLSIHDIDYFILPCNSSGHISTSDHDFC